MSLESDNTHIVEPASGRGPAVRRPTLPPEPLLLTVPEAARLVNVATSTGWSYVRQGIWPSVKMGRTVRIPMAAFRAYIEARTTGGR
jgi:excisionase family DNA binding protein